MNYPRSRLPSIPAKLRAESLHEHFGCGEARAAVGAGKSLQSLKSRRFTTSPRLSASKRWSISAWLIGSPKGDAGQHLEGRKIKTPASRALFAQLCGQCLVVDLCSEKRNHRINNPQLKTSKSQLLVAAEECGDEFHDFRLLRRRQIHRVAFVIVALAPNRVLLAANRSRAPHDCSARCRSRIYEHKLS